MGHRVDWKAFLRDSERANVSGNAAGEGQHQIFEEFWFALIGFVVLFEGVVVAMIALRFGGVWITKSPLLNLTGSIAVFVLLCICLVGGAIWWCLTGSTRLLEWAIGFFPFGAQPTRSGFGIIALFLPFALLSWRTVFRLRSHSELVDKIAIGLVVTLVLTALFAILVNTKFTPAK